MKIIIYICFAVAISLTINSQADSLIGSSSKISINIKELEEVLVSNEDKYIIKTEEEFFTLNTNLVNHKSWPFTQMQSRLDGQEKSGNGHIYFVTQGDRRYYIATVENSNGQEVLDYWGGHGMPSWVVSSANSFYKFNVIHRKKCNLQKWALGVYGCLWIKYNGEYISKKIVEGSSLGNNEKCAICSRICWGDKGRPSFKAHAEGSGINTQNLSKLVKEVIEFDSDTSLDALVELVIEETKSGNRAAQKLLMILNNFGFVVDGEISLEDMNNTDDMENDLDCCIPVVVETLEKAFDQAIKITGINKILDVADQAL